jgi:adenosylhomocysteine nucleosidase
MRIRLLWLLSCQLLFSAVFSAEAPAVPTYYKPHDVIVILGAVPQEITVFTAAMAHPQKRLLWGIPYYRGELEGKNVVVAITGIGKSNAAMTTTLFITQFKPRLVLMSGTGARINAELRTGDVILASTTHEHDYGSLTREGMVYRPMNGPKDGQEVQNAFSPPSLWLAKAEAAIVSYQAPQVSANGDTYTIKVRRGVVSSSDLFGVTQQRINQLRGDFHTDIMEMESAPLAHVCETLGVPYLIVRAGSNVAQEAPNDDYLRLGPIAAREAAKFTLHLLSFL